LSRSRSRLCSLRRRSNRQDAGDIGCWFSEFPAGGAHRYRLGCILHLRRRSTEEDDVALPRRGLASEFGLTVPHGIGKLDELFVLVHADKAFPEKSRQVFTGLFEQCLALVASISALEAEIVAHTRQNDTARRLAALPGVGPITASLIAATVADIGVFKSARHFVVPRQYSTGGKTRLGWITKTGDREIRSLQALGATSMVYRAHNGIASLGCGRGRTRAAGL
jgi:transposase